MEYTVDAPEFGDRRVTVQTSSLFSGPKLLVDGAPATKQGQQYLVPLANGQTVPVKLKAGFDPIPAVEVAGRLIRLAEPLKWYEYVWACLPLVLIGLGGAIGGAIGGATAWANMTIFRTQENPVLRYVFSALATVGAFVGWFVLATAILGTMRR
jgi:hypothetical protein